MTHEVPAVVLLSGGLDSATLVAMAADQGFAPFCLTVRYGQRHGIEVQSARAVARQLGAPKHEIVDLNLRQFGGSALTDDIAVPKDTPRHEMGTEIPVTYVPARNTILLSLALAWAETLGANDIFIGVNALDFSGYPDCRPEFIAAFQALGRVATKAGVEGNDNLVIHAPLIEMTKAQIIQRGKQLGVDYSLTCSCYDPDDRGLACGHCDACVLRREGFERAGLPDPTIYQEVVNG
jgi:7-cyano-7-deazaguanine synthase